MNTHAKLAKLDKDARKRAFQKCSEQYLKSLKLLTGSLTEKDKISIFTYNTAFVSAKNKRPFVEGESVIKPCLINWVDIFEDQPFGKKHLERNNIRFWLRCTRFELRHIR